MGGSSSEITMISGSTSMAGGGQKSSVGVVGAGGAAEKRLTARQPVFGRGRGAWEVTGA
jgi:hypothetical protein